MSKNKKITNLPSPSIGGLSIYLGQIKKFPMLEADEEYSLAKNWLVPSIPPNTKPYP